MLHFRRFVAASTPFLWVSHSLHFRLFLACSRPFNRRSFRPIFGRSRGQQFWYLSGTYSSRNLPVSVPHPCHWHGKGRFWAPLAFFASRVGKMVAATIKSPWRASCGPVCQILALSRTAVGSANLVVILGSFIPWFFPGGTVVLPLLIRDAAPFFMGVGFVGILTAFSRLFSRFFTAF